MARATLVQRKAELDALLRNADGTSKVGGVTAAYDHEPARRGGLPPVFTTCVIAGMTPEVWQFAVRLYIDITADPEAAEESLATLMPAVDAVIGNAAGGTHFGPSNWTVEIPDGVNAIVATNILDSGREDYF